MPRIRTHASTSLLLALLIASLLTACGTSFLSDRSQSGADAQPQATSVAQAPDNYPNAGRPADDKRREDGPDTPDTTERLIIRDQTFRFRVASTQEAMDAVRDLVGQHSATITSMYIASEDDYVHNSASGKNRALQGWLVVRVPGDKLDGFTQATMDLGELIHQKETADDVTQEHVDLSARLENLRAQEQRLRELMERANTVDEVLMVEKELWRVRGDIESLDAQVQYLERQAAMATVTLEFVEEGADGPDIGQPFLDGLESAVVLVSFLITMIIATSPLWLLGLLVFFIIRRVRRSRRAARLAAEDADGPREEKSADASTAAAESEATTSDPQASAPGESTGSTDPASTDPAPAGQSGDAPAPGEAPDRGDTH